MVILLTGAVGFIGYHVAHALLRDGHVVVGVDDCSNTPWLAKLRLEDLLQHYPNTFVFSPYSICQKGAMQFLFESHKVDCCIHLAAKAGVQESITNPKPYIETNFHGFDVMIGLASAQNVPFFYASSGSVYGDTMGEVCEYEMPVPKNLYGLSKYYNELAAQDYWEKRDFPSVGFRFFNVYGRWGRFDSLFYKLLQSTEEKPVTLYGGGILERDFTHVSDIVQGILLAVKRYSSRQKNAVVFNLARGEPRPLAAAVEYLSPVYITVTDRIPEGEILKSHAYIRKAMLFLEYSPKVSLEEGLRDLRRWWDETMTTLLAAKSKCHLEAGLDV